MKINSTVLHLTVGEPVSASLARTRAAMKAARQGKPAQPYFDVGVEDVGELFSVFTPKRWELIGALREGGAITIAELARRLKRDYKNVYNDCRSFCFTGTRIASGVINRSTGNRQIYATP